MALQNDGTAKATTVINIRKLAALDLVLHGPRFILMEFGFGVFFSAGLGLLLFYSGIFPGHFRFPLMIILGGWMTFLALNFLPLLLYAISLMRRKSAQSEIALELAHKDAFVRKYTRQSLLLILPMVVPILALSQEMQRRK